MNIVVPAITPERLYLQDKRRREWDAKERWIDLVLMQRIQRDNPFDLPVVVKSHSPEMQNLCLGLLEFQKYFTSSTRR